MFRRKEKQKNQVKKSVEALLEDQKICLLSRLHRHYQMNCLYDFLENHRAELDPLTASTRDLLERSEDCRRMLGFLADTLAITAKIGIEESMNINYTIAWLRDMKDYTDSKVAKKGAEEAKLPPSDPEESPGDITHPKPRKIPAEGVVEVVGEIAEECGALIDLMDSSIEGERPNALLDVVDEVACSARRLASKTQELQDILGFKKLNN